MQGELPLASVVILNYNGLGYLDECLSSVLAQDYPNYEVIFVDNASSDGSCDFVRQRFPSVMLVENTINYGYAEGNNVGIRQSKGEYVVVLNFDTVVERNWLRGLVRALEDNKEASICMSKVLVYGQEATINSDGNQLSFLGFGWCGNYGRRDDRKDGTWEVTYPAGCSLALRRSALDKVGLFDADYFVSMEDAELGIRMRLAGYRVLCAASSVIYHKYSRVQGGRLLFLERDRLMFLLKTFEWRTLLLILPAFLVGELATTLFALKEGWLRGKLKTYSWVLKNFPSILRKRRDIQRTRVMGDRQLLSWLRGGIYHPEIQNFALSYVLNPFLEIYFWLLRIALRVPRGPLQATATGRS